MKVSYTRHALARMEQRGITRLDVETALARQFDPPEPGLPGTIWITGMAAGGKILRVCLPVGNHYHVITAAWPDPQGGYTE